MKPQASGKLGLPLVLSPGFLCRFTVFPTCNRTVVEQLADYFGRLSKLHCAALTLALVVGIAIADYVSGYALRLSLLYLLPIGLAAWAISLAAGIVTAVVACLLWLLSFQKGHFYQEQAYYFWEAAIMLCSFMVVAWLSDRLRRALKQADERFFRVVERVRSAIYIMDEEQGVIAYGNPVMKALAGELEALDAKSFEARFQFSPTTPALHEPRPNPCPVKDTVTGRWYWRQEAAIPWAGTAMKLVVLADITEQQNAARLREKHLEIMHHSAQLITLAETASTLAHEINQPLMVIATYTDACQRMIDSREVDPAEVSSILKKCHDQAVRASRIIDRLREFIRQRQSRPMACGTQALLAEALETTRSQLDEAQIRVSVVNRAPERIIEADKTLLLQALANLIRNAVEAMDAIPVEQRALILEVMDHPPDQLLFRIEDRGCGLAPELVDSMFSPFVTSKVNGLGLGLSICKSIAEAHGGRLWAENNQYAGATFHLLLPIRPS